MHKFFMIGSRPLLAPKRTLLLSLLLLSLFALSNIAFAETLKGELEKSTGTVWGFPSYKVSFEVSDDAIAEVTERKDGNLCVRFNRPGDVYVRVTFYSGGVPADTELYLFHVYGPPVDSSTIDPDTYAERVLELINSEREKEGLDPLCLADDLCEYAMIRAEELTERFDHIRPDGSDFSTVLPRKSYRLAGENVACGQITPYQVVEHWMNSKEHRENILYPDFTEMGIAYLYAPDSQYRHYWAQLFRRK